MKRIGDKRIHSGYVILTPIGSEKIAEHVAVAEKALGKKLPRGAVVHHVDENRSNNSPQNLVICESPRYHSLIHTRMLVAKAGGNPVTEKKCTRCKSIKPRAEFYSSSLHLDGKRNHCRECALELARINNPKRQARREAKRARGEKVT